MACKTVEKYNANGSLIESFASCAECSKKENVSVYNIRHHNTKDNLYNGVYYITVQPKPYYVKATCDYCGKEFDCQRFRTEDGREHLFCSKKCEGAFRKNQTELNCVCEMCGTRYHAQKNHIERYGSKYCSKECKYKAMKIYMKGDGNHQYGLKGSKNATWKSDERISFYGYRLIRVLDHPFKNCDDFVFEHRLVAEKYLLTEENSVVINGKRYLSKDYVVHHIDFNRLNNDPNNLLVMTESEHAQMHANFRNDKCFKEYCQTYGLDENVVRERSKESKKWKPTDN